MRTGLVEPLRPEGDAQPDRGAQKPPLGILSEDDPEVRAGLIVAECPSRRQFPSLAEALLNGSLDRRQDARCRGERDVANSHLGALADVESESRQESARTVASIHVRQYVAFGLIEASQVFCLASCRRRRCRLTALEQLELRTQPTLGDPVVVLEDCLDTAAELNVDGDRNPSRTPWQGSRGDS